MFQRTSTPLSGPRNSTPSVRGGSRGGIQKRRAGPARVDKDGDLVMDAVASGERRRAGRNQPRATISFNGQATGHQGSGTVRTRGNLGIQRAQQSILRGLGTQQASVLESRISDSAKGKEAVFLLVHGLKSSKAASNPDGGLRDLLGFLERKASGLDAKSNRTVRIKKSHKEGDSVIITVSPQDSASILKLDSFKFAGATLSIEICEAPALGLSRKVGEEEELSQTAKETQDRIRAILSNRYDTNLKLLNLSALGQDPDLVQMGMFDEKKRISKLFPVLMIVCDRLFKSAQEKRDAIVSVTLADNELDSVSNVTALAQTFPDLKNLDLSRNKFADLRSLEAWRWRFRNLENLLMSDNPIETLLPQFKVEIVKWFPKLQVLNGNQARTAEDITTTAEATKGLSPIPLNGPDFRDVAQIGENFVRQFLTLYDTDRSALAGNFYDAQSLHSIAINMSAPRDPQQSIPIPPWTDYIKHSRNLIKLTHLPARMSRQYRGIQAIKSVWSNLPATRHPDLPTQAAKYLIDCHPLPGLSDPTGQSNRGVDGLILYIHGEYEERGTLKSDPAMRSFSRTFVLGPGIPGGPSIRVVSDILALRAWTPLTFLLSGANASAPTSTKQQKHEDLTLQLVSRTGMTPNYAMLCLTETSFDLEKAFIVFNANKDKLPPDAFVRSSSAGGR